MVRPKNQTNVKDRTVQRIHDIPCTIKYSLHHERISTLFQILKLYDRTVSEDADPEHIPADLVHHFLLAICTRPGIGICFKDRGWYPRGSDGGDDRTANDDDEDELTQKGGKIYNKILANILKSLKVNEDSRQQELALKIMSACPELVAGYVLFLLNNVNSLINRLGTGQEQP